MEISCSVCFEITFFIFCLLELIQGYHSLMGFQEYIKETIQTESQIIVQLWEKIVKKHNILLHEPLETTKQNPNTIITDKLSITSD